jgi:hypothetical protein
VVELLPQQRGLTAVGLPVPLSVNGVRIGMVLLAGAFAVGAVLPVTTCSLPSFLAEPP